MILEENKIPFIKYISDFFFIIKWYLFGRLKIGRVTRKQKAMYLFNKHIDNLPKGSIVIDAGANVGVYSKLFLDRGFKVYAFEPDPIALKEFKKKINDDNNLILYETAIGLKKNTQKLYRYRKFDIKKPHSTQGSSLLSYRSGFGKPFEEIKVIDFIEFLKSFNKKIALLKMDIEGSEVEIINSIISNNLHQNIEEIFVETHERFSHKLALETIKLRLRIQENKIHNINLNWV
tara:strand:+ start:1169 stop:1867 length:699 start_codon:yes stop_codon:yes gene_type:complete